MTAGWCSMGIFNELSGRAKSDGIRTKGWLRAWHGVRKPIDLATLTTLQTPTHELPVARLTALVVSWAHRRQGVARVLVTAVLRRARELGREGVELTSGMRSEREAAHAFYLDLGFDRTSHRYWLPLRPGTDTSGVVPGAA